MAADPLEQVLRLVAEGRLSAEEAAPLLSALDGRPGRPAGDPDPGTGDEPPSFAAPTSAPSLLRLEVREAGRTVVSLRLPVALGRHALDRVPGLSGDQVERVREALRTGTRGPILLVEDGDNAVRIVLE
jgi:hypothetical protein